MEAKVRAYGKVNLSLLVTGVRDGLHTLDSVVASVDLYDTVTVKIKKGNGISVSFLPCGDFATAELCAAIPERNSVTRAYAALSAVHPFGAEVQIVKRLPFGGGLGGSSADAAGFLYAAGLLMPDIAAEELYRAAAAAGSDVAVMLRGGYVRMRGTGEETTPFDAPPLYLAVAQPEGQVLSRDAYAFFDKHSSPTSGERNDALVRALQAGDFAGIERNLCNALAEAAFSLCPAMRSLYKRIAETGGTPFVTGSGSCCVGLYTSYSQAERAAEQLQQNYAAVALRTIPYGCDKIE